MRPGYTLEYCALSSMDLHGAVFFLEDGAQCCRQRIDDVFKREKWQMQFSVEESVPVRR